MVPAFAPPADLEPGDYRMAQVDVERSQEFRKCIECFMCNNVCHAVRDHEENKTTFSGPRFLMRIAELDMHPLDTVDRRQVAVDDHGLGYCNITKCCTEVCPEHIHITDNAIIPLKERVADVGEFVESVRRVAEGGTAFDPEVVAQLMGRRRRDDPLSELTPREREVLSLMAEGLSNSAIAKKLWLTLGAVEKHISSIFGRLGLLPGDDENRRVRAVLTYLEGTRGPVG